jgi:CBS domain-containing protein
MGALTDVAASVHRESGDMHQQAPETADESTSRPATARELMTPGVVALPIATRVPVAVRALARHRIHAVLVVGFDGRPQGWLSAASLTSLTNPDRSLAWAMQAFGEPITAIDPFADSEEVRGAMRAPEVHRLAVQERFEWMPEGVITELDQTEIHP